MSFSGKQTGTFGTYFHVKTGSTSYRQPTGYWGGKTSSPAPAPAPKPAPAPPPPDPVPVERWRTTVSQGTLIPVGYGSEGYAGHIAWGERDNLGTASYAVILFEPLDQSVTRALVKAMRNGELYYDATTGYKREGFNYRFYPGSFTQEPDPYIVAAEGAYERANAFRGRCYLFIEGDDFADGGTPDGWKFIVADGTSSNLKTVYSPSHSTLTDSSPVLDWIEGLLWVAWDDGTIRAYSIHTHQQVYQVSGNLGSGGGLPRLIPETGRVIAYTRAGGSGSSKRLQLIDHRSGAVLSETTTLWPSSTSNILVHSHSYVPAGGAIMIVGTAWFDEALFVVRYDTGAETVTKISGEKGWGGHSWVGGTSPGRSYGNVADVWVGGGANLYRLTVSSTGIVATELQETFAANVMSLHYIDSEDAVVVWLANSTVTKIRVSDNTVLFSQSVPYTVNVWDFQHQRPTNSVMISGPDGYHETSLTNGTTTFYSAPTISRGSTVWDGVNRTIYHTDAANSPFQYQFGLFTPGGNKTLSEFFELSAIKAGYSASEFRTINIPDTIIGARIDGPTDFISGLMRSYSRPFRFDVYYSFDEILAKRPLADGAFVVDATITEDDMVFDGQSLVTFDRRQDADNPRIVEFQYDDPDNDFEVTPQRAQKHHSPTRTIESMRTEIIRLPVAVTADHAKQTIAPLPHMDSTAKLGLNFTTGAKFAYLEPTTLVNVVTDGHTHTIKIERATLHDDEAQSISARAYLTDHASTAPGFSGTRLADLKLGDQGTRFILGDWPLIDVSDDTEGDALRVYGIITSQGQDDWLGGDAWLSYTQSGFQHLAREMDSHPVIGTLIGALSDPGDTLTSEDPGYIEDTTEWQASFSTGGSGQPVADLDELIAESIAFSGSPATNNPGLVLAVGKNRRWEILLPSAYSIANGIVTFTGTTYRGLAGTDVFAGDHASGDHVVMIRPAYLTNFLLPTTDYERTIYFKATGLAQHPNDVLATSGVISGAANKPYAPTAVSAVTS